MNHKHCAARQTETLMDVELIISDFCINGSLHGPSHLFHRQSYRVKVAWTLLMLASFTACSYYSIETLKEHLIEIPVVTEISFETKQSLKFPKILFCPTMPTRERVQLFYGELMEIEDIVDLMLITSMNPLFSDFRYDLHENISNAFKESYQIEHKWKEYSATYNQSTLVNNSKSMNISLNFPK